MKKKIVISLFLYILVLLFLLSNKLVSKEVIAIVKSQDLALYNEIIDSFKMSAYRLEKYNIKIYNGENDAKKIKKIFIDLKKDKPKLIITVGLQVTDQAQQIIDNIPIIFCGVHNWKKFIKKKDNITGIDLFPGAKILLSNFRLILPHLKNIGFMYTPNISNEIIKRFERIKKEENINIYKGKIQTKWVYNEVTVKQIEKIIEKIINKIDILYLPSDPLIINDKTLPYIIETCQYWKIPLFTSWEEFVEWGALASFFPNHSNIGSQLAVIARKILLKNIPPKKIDVSKPVGLIFSINFTTKSKLNLNIDHLEPIIDKSYY